MKSESFKSYFIFFIGLLTFFWVFKFFDGLESVNYIIDNKNSLYLLILAHIPTLYFDSICWRLLMMKKSISITWCFIITWISQTAGRVIPTGMISGEFVRVYLGAKRGLSWAESSSTVIADLALASISLLFMVVFSILILFFSSGGDFISDKNFGYILLSISLLLVFSAMFVFVIRKRILSLLIRKSKKLTFFHLQRKTLISLIKFDNALYKLSFKLKILFLAIFFRLLGWLGGSFEIYIFFSLIGIDVSFQEVIVIESFTAIIKSIVFFIPAGIGVQEFAFVIAGDYVGLSGSVSLSAALGRRIREFFVGMPAIISWYYMYRRNLNTN